MKCFYWWLEFVPSALFSLSTCFFAHKNTLCLSQSVPLSALSLSLSCGLREKIEKKNTLADSAHIAKLLTGHTVCLQDTMHTRYQTAAQ